MDSRNCGPNDHHVSKRYDIANASISDLRAIEELEKKTQLHQSINIIYLVTHYEATYFSTDDTDFGPSISAIGKTIIEALANLNKVAVKPERK